MRMSRFFAKLIPSIAGLIPLVSLGACSEQPADPDLSGEAKIEAEGQSLTEAADEAARIVEKDSAKTIEEHHAEAAAAAAAAGALYAGQAAQPSGSGRRQPQAVQP